MAMMPHHSIVTARVVAPTNPMTNVGDVRFKNDGERKLYAAYKRNLDSAQALATSGKYHDAWILLNIAVECFFKHVYVLLRPEFSAFAIPTRRFPLGPLDFDGVFVFFHEKSRFGEGISLKDFGHEVMTMWRLIWLFTDLNADSHLNTLKNHLPSQSDWVDARYDLANHATFEAKYKDYLKSFTDCLSNTFGRFQ